MLPLRHSNKINENRNTDGVFIRKSERPSLRLNNLPYYVPPGKDDSTNASLRYSGCPPLASQFRQRPCPVYLQENRPKPFQNRLNVPFNGMHEGAVYQKVTLGNMGGSFSTPMPSSPRSPVLDQVLTELRPGPNVAWFCERKREKSNLWYYKVLFVVFMLLMMGLIAFKRYAFTEEFLEPTQLKTDDITFQDHSMKTPNFEEETVMQVEPLAAAAAINNDGNMDDKLVHVPLPAPTNKIVYSVNEDFETTVEAFDW